ncbi:MAG TPA: ABC transporter substrate-binding protein, partial [Polyangiaceae bacterium]|nr:ABC transporter substrate-binding protein [Polyangiaceae bacterium]
MVRQRLARAVTCACLLLGLVSCRREQRESAGSLPRSETLYVGGRQWGEPSSFNPLLGWMDWPAMPGVNLLYESLFYFDMLSGKLEPLLAKSYTQTDEAITVVLNEGTHWNDGKPLTSEDVKYTFDLGKRFKSVPVAPVWSYLEEVKAPDASTVVFVIDKTQKNPLVVLDALQDIRIVPRHVVEPELARLKDDINEFNKLKFDKDPVGSGPYRLHSFSSEKVVTMRDDAYWGIKSLYAGKSPAPKYIVHPIYKSNDHFSVALQQGRLDASSTFVPRIWLKQKKGVQSWYQKEPFFIPSAVPMLFVNATKKPLDDAHMRRAMAFSINYRDIRELAVSGYSEPLQPGLILPFGLEAKYYNEEDVKQYGATVFDPERAKAELKAGGYQPVWDADGKLIETRDKNGQKLPTITVRSPTGWSDWESIVRIAVKGMRDVGIDARERFIDASIYWGAQATGEFDLIMITPASAPTPSKPWSRFDAVVSTKDFLPLGDKMYKNMGRFNDPKGAAYEKRFDELLNLIPKLKSEEELKAAYRELNVLYMK